MTTSETVVLLAAAEQMRSSLSAHYTTLLGLSSAPNVCPSKIPFVIQPTRLLSETKHFQSSRESVNELSVRQISRSLSTSPLAKWWVNFGGMVQRSSIAEISSVGWKWRSAGVVEIGEWMNLIPMHCFIPN